MGRNPLPYPHQKITTLGAKWLWSDNHRLKETVGDFRRKSSFVWGIQKTHPTDVRSWPTKWCIFPLNCIKHHVSVVLVVHYSIPILMEHVLVRLYNGSFPQTVLIPLTQRHRKNIEISPSLITLQTAAAHFPPSPHPHQTLYYILHLVLCNPWFQPLPLFNPSSPTPHPHNTKFLWSFFNTITNTSPQPTPKPHIYPFHKPPILFVYLILRQN